MELVQQFGWRPEIGDPTLVGWLTVAAYGLAAITALLAARRAACASGSAGGSRTIWLLVTALMAFLCLNKQLDLQSLFTDIGRVISRKQGWYEARREFQKWFVLAMLVSSAAGALLVIVMFRGFWKSHFLLILGWILLLAFIVVRAVSIHHFDAFADSHMAEYVNRALELGGISLIWLAALRDYRMPRSTAKPRKRAA